MDDKINSSLSIFGNFLSKLSENSDYVYWLSSPDFKKIQYISPAYEQIWGRSRDELYLNPKVWINFLHPEDSNQQHPINEMAEKVERFGEMARFSVHYRIIRPNGDIRWIMDNGFPIFDSQGLCCGVTGVAVDVTKEKKYELELKAAKEKAEAANRAKTEFIENMSHDIRTPLSGVIGMSNLLMQGLQEPQQKQFAQWINDSGEQLLKLLNGILDVISADNISDNDINKEFFDLRQCVKDIIELERPTAYLKGLELRGHVDNEIPKYLYSDRMKVHRIILNLLGNAIKFTEKGYVSISARLLELKNQQALIHFSVSDSGIGILKEQQDKVFERFHKVSPSNKGIYSGYGVGLHIVLAYIRSLGGEIRLTSNPGIGTTFDFNLSFECLMNDRVHNSSYSLRDEDCVEQPQLPLIRSCRVLIIEDNLIALKIAETVVEDAGCCVSIAKDGEQALSLIEENDFDLILTDIGLPGISGYEFTRAVRSWELKKKKKEIPIIGLSAHAKTYTETNGLQAGMTDMYTKPITVELMKSILAKHMVDLVVAEKEDRKQGRLGIDLPDSEEELFALTSIPLLNMEKAIQTVGNEVLIRQVLQLMISGEIDKDIALIKMAHAKGDWHEISEFAHKMKGGALYIGTEKMHYACQYLERYQKAGHTSLLEPLYQQLISVVRETQDYIGTLLRF